jgi:hypothetical protein
VALDLGPRTAAGQDPLRAAVRRDLAAVRIHGRRLGRVLARSREKAAHPRGAVRVLHPDHLGRDPSATGVLLGVPGRVVGGTSPDAVVVPTAGRGGAVDQEPAVPVADVVEFGSVASPSATSLAPLNRKGGGSLPRTGASARGATAPDRRRSAAPRK